MFIILNCKRIRVAGGARGENTLTVSRVVKVRGGMSRAHMVHVSPPVRTNFFCVCLSSLPFTIQSNDKNNNPRI